MSVEGICFIAGMGSVLVLLPVLSAAAAVRRKHGQGRKKENC